MECDLYPKLGEDLFGIVLSHDVTQAQGRWLIAEKQQKSGMRLFGAHYIASIAAAFQTRLVSSIVVVGGDEPDHNINRAAAIKLALVMDQRIPADRVQAVRSQPNTEGNAGMMRQWLVAHFIPLDQCIAITSIWHCTRAAAFFRIHGMSLPFVPAESIWLAASRSEAERADRADALRREFGGSDLAFTVVSEAVGISQILDGTYQTK